MIRRISHKSFLDFMTKNGYSELEAKHLFATVKTMDKETRKWFIDWFYGKGFPQKQVEGVTVEYLTKNYGLNPVNAFIVIDWLKTDPQAAKYFMLKIPPAEMIINDTTADEMRIFLKGKEHKFNSEAENTEDIVE